MSLTHLLMNTSILTSPSLANSVLYLYHTPVCGHAILWHTMTCVTLLYHLVSSCRHAWILYYYSSFTSRKESNLVHGLNFQLRAARVGMSYIHQLQAACVTVHHLLARVYAHA